MARRVKSRMLWLQDSDTAFWIAPMEAVRKGQDAGLDNHPFGSFLVLLVKQRQTRRSDIRRLVLVWECWAQDLISAHAPS